MDLEKEFEKHVKVVQKQIEEKLKLANKSLNEATKLAEKEGVSFYSNLSPLDQAYVVRPKGKFAELDEQTVSEITDAGGEYEGWQHSAVC